MKTIILVLLFVVGNSCDSSIKETPTESIENTVKPIDNNDSNTRPPIHESIGPGEVTLKIKVMEVYNSGKDICGISKKNVMKMEVQEIVERGSSIVNLPNKNDEVLMNFILVPKDLLPNSLIEAKVKESLCTDASKTYFTIISYKIIE